MLIYHPVYDVNHCLYRMLLILENSTQDEFDWDTLKLLDFYTLFPQLLKSIKPMPVSLCAFSKVIKQIPDAYEALPNAKRVLFDLGNLQNTAMMNLLAKEFVDVELYHKKVIKRSAKELPSMLEEELKGDSVISEEWFRFVVNELPLTSFMGKDGLKKRSGMMEFKYDVEG